MQDPYSFLGVSRDADETQIKKAYRTLSKKYHPDNNPGDARAEENFKKVQAAYEQIMKEKKQGYSDYDYNDAADTGNYGFRGFEGFGGFGGFGGFTGDYRDRNTSQEEDQTTRDLRSAAVYINNRYYDQALNVLNSMEERTDRWYYYSAIANMGIGNNVTALEHAQTAARMNPASYEYADLVNRIENGSNIYTDRAGHFEINPSSGGNLCMKVLLLNVVCNLCFGGSGLCCGSGGMPFFF